MIFRPNIEVFKLLILLSFAVLSRLLTDNGGKIVGLDEPKLTHVVIDKRDESRRLELIKRTSKFVCLVEVVTCSLTWLIFRPKRRHLVISEYIRACLDEETLLDEDGTHLLTLDGHVTDSYWFQNLRRRQMIGLSVYHSSKIHTFQVSDDDNSIRISFALQLSF